MKDVVEVAKKEKEHSKLHKASIVSLAVSIVCLFTIIFLLFWPTTVIVPNRQPYRVITPTVKAGENMVYEVDACKYYDVSSMVTREIVVESVHYPLSPLQNNISKGCNKTHVSIMIPSVIPPGTAYLDLTVSYYLSALKTETYHFKTEEFIIN